MLDKDLADRGVGAWPGISEHFLLKLLFVCLCDMRCALAVQQLALWGEAGAPGGTVRHAAQCGNGAPALRVAQSSNFPNDHG